MDGDVFGEWLATLVLNDILGQKSNPLQPSVKHSGNYPGPRFNNLDALLDFFLKYLDVLRAPLGIIKGKGKTNKKVEDQDCRGRMLAYLLLPHQKVVRLMDGRCGLLLTYLSNVRDLYGTDRLNSLTIELVDIVPEVTIWHKLMYRCRNIHCLTENILSLAKPLTVNVLLYLNFCGIAKHFAAVITYLQSYSTECMISFSTARRAQKKNYEKMLIASLPGYSLRKLPSQRNDFATWVVARSQAYADRVDLQPPMAP
jgi:hypothetical protein